MTADLTVTAAELDRTRRQFAQLRCLAGSTSDQALRERLQQLSAKLLDAAAALGPGSVENIRPGPQHLTGREIDVLAVVGVGATNSEAAERLGVSTETVKGYLRTAMHKLHSTNRTIAVQTARRQRLIP